MTTLAVSRDGPLPQFPSMLKGLDTLGSVAVVAAATLATLAVPATTATPAGVAAVHEAHHYCHGSQSIYSSVLKSDACKAAKVDNYEWLITQQLTQYRDYNIRLNATMLRENKNSLSAIVYIKDNELYMESESSGSVTNSAMIDTYTSYIRSLSQKAAIPDLVMAISGEDNPQAKQFPIFSYCRRPSSHNDLLLPNQIEDRLWDGVGEEHHSRAGRNDTRAPKVVWYGRPNSWYRGLRKVVSDAGAANADRIHTGLTQWQDFPGWYKNGQEQEWENYRKGGLPQREWAEQYKYQLNVQGNCASSRLAYQLFTDSAVFIMSTDDQEWYTPLLRPYLHYIPVYAADGDEHSTPKTENIIEQLEWAESNPDLIEAIVARSTDFAETHLRPGKGRDCYSLMLLHAYAQLMEGEIEIPADATHLFTDV